MPIPKENFALHMLPTHFHGSSRRACIAARRACVQVSGRRAGRVFAPFATKWHRS